MLDVLQPREAVQAWVDAFNAVDVAKISDLYAEDATYHDMMQPVVTGRDAIREMFKQEFSQFQIFCIIDKIEGSGHWVTIDWRDPNGVQGCGYFEVKDGKITHQRGYWDKASFLMSFARPPVAN